MDLTSLEPGTTWVSGRPLRTDLEEAARNSALEPKDVYCLLSRSSVLANRGSIPGGRVCRGETGRGAGLYSGARSSVVPIVLDSALSILFRSGSSEAAGAEVSDTGAVHGRSKSRSPVKNTPPAVAFD